MPIAYAKAGFLTVLVKEADGFCNFHKKESLYFLGQCGTSMFFCQLSGQE